MTNNSIVAKFHVIESISLAARDDMYFFYGDVVSGTINLGMHLLVGLNHQVSIKIPIVAIEFIDGTSTGSHVALGIELSKDFDRSFMDGLNIHNETVSISSIVSDAVASKKL